MKKIFTTLAIASLSLGAFAQTITQNTTPNTVDATGGVACASLATSTNYYTSDNSYTRLFKLSDYGITYDYRITNIAFGVQLASRTLAGSNTDIGGTFPVEVWVYTTTGTTPAGTLTPVGSSAIATVDVSSADNAAMVNTGVIDAVIPAGSNFVVEIWHDGTDGKDGTAATPYERFYMGTNAGGQSAPSYLSSQTCGILSPIAVGTGALASFNSQWVMTITGQNALGVTEVLNSRDLQIYPNPVKDVLKFRFANQLKSETIEIYDMNGKLVQSVNSKNVNELNMSSYAKGNYILKVKASDNQVYVQKIIKE